MSVKDFIADLARPYTFYSLATASSIAVVKIGWEISDGYQGAAFMGVVLAGASAIYIGKSWENRGASADTREVEKIRAQASPPPAKALAPASGESELGELPLTDRVER